ncbi:hypothetical protein CC86DRAFT_402402 [Ophiobolus disseminans]|uniref:Uncharacterized protein n=1 Tax=Ophiobolus disseminans TaxID=1469910 RepID=A0A6A7ACB4_9PLEO|nr:hypothetical protein CC86DRAFT_402402 [Ophiobolus disseminans]
MSSIANASCTSAGQGTLPSNLSDAQASLKSEAAPFNSPDESPSETRQQKDADLQFAFKAAALLGIALIAYCLITTAIKDIAILCPVAYILSQVYRIEALSKILESVAAELECGHTFIDLARLSDLFDDVEDHQNILIWMDGLATLVEPECNSSIVDVSKNTLQIVRNAAPTNMSQFEDLMKQHGYPAFHDSDIWHDVTIRWKLNHNNVLYDNGLKDLPMACESSFPGRSAVQDFQDIEFMWSAVASGLAPELLAYFAKYEPIYICTSASGTINSLEDVMNVDATRVRRFTPACPEKDRQLCGLNSGQRSYLNDEEKQAINHGVCEYNKYWTYYPELSELQKQLQVNPANAKLQEEELFDDTAFEPCYCGDAALKSLVAYRNEPEINYNPTTSPFKEFPLQFVDDQVLVDRWFLNVTGGYIVEDDRIPRCKKIRQICDLHELKSNNIFVLVDTSVDNIQDRLVHPIGPLPVPGFKSQAQYPPDFQTLPRLLQIPYENLATRCKHGFLHPPNLSCEVYFSQGQHHNSAECVDPDAVQFQRKATYGFLQHNMAVSPNTMALQAAGDYTPVLELLQPQPKSFRPKFWFET